MSHILTLLALTASLSSSYTLPIVAPRLAITSDGIGTLESAQASPHLYIESSFQLDYSLSILEVYETDTDLKVGTLIRHRLSTTLQSSIGLYDTVTIAVGIPITYFGTPDIEPGLLPNAGVEPISGLGDAYLTTHVQVLGSSDSAFDLALSVPVTFPTAKSGSFLGEYGISAIPALIVSTGWLSFFGDESTTQFRPHARVGYHLRSPAEGFGMLVDDALDYTLGLAASALGPDDTPIRGYLAYHESRVFALSCCGRRVNPREIQAGGSYPLSFGFIDDFFSERSEVRLTMGIGLGVGNNPMTPDKRILVGLELGHQVPVDSDSDGLLDEDDACPLRPEDKDGLGDLDGCPETDHDQDGVLDEDDRCQEEPETLNDFEDEDGCPDEAPSVEEEAVSETPEPGPEIPEEVVKEMETLNEILGTLRFRKGKKKPKRGSREALLKMAEYLKTHPTIQKVRIIGHTDSKGRAKRNLILSRQRAEKVRDLLVELGVKAERMETEGRGDTEPIANNKKRKGRAQNRRIVMVVIETGTVLDPAAPPAAPSDVSAAPSSQP